MGNYRQDLEDEQHCEYWEQWGIPLGLELRSFTHDASACFTDKASGENICISRYQGERQSPNFQTFDRLRSLILGAVPSATEEQ